MSNSCSCLRTSLARLSSVDVPDPGGDVTELVSFTHHRDGSNCEELRAAIERRSTREPLAYITGFQRVGGHRFAVPHGTFVPRTHSNAAIDTATALLSRSSSVVAPRVLDLCCGVGPYLISLASRIDALEGVGVDTNAEAISAARLNAGQILAVSRPSRVSFHRMSVEKVDFGPFDLVVANPPFMPSSAEPSPEYGLYQPNDAIFAGEDGLAVIHEVVEAACRTLTRGGVLVVEHGPLAFEGLMDLLDGRLKVQSTHADGNGLPLFSTFTRVGQS